MRLAERHRINPRRKKKEPAKPKPSSVIRRPRKEKEVGVIYMNKGVYDAPSFKEEESFDELLERVNSEFNLKLEDDADKLLLEIFRRGWKVNGLDLGSGRTYGIRFHRNVGGEKSRTYSKKSESIKKLLLISLEHILNQENNRYEHRMDKLRKRSRSLSTAG
jgi:hypothetical protein